jgi:carboxylate-amine ligase
MQFKPSTPLTLGVELELQILNRRDCDLVGSAADLLALIERSPHTGDIKPEITESMIEISTGVHRSYAPLRAELEAIRRDLTAAAERLNLLIAGGGAHPFQRWSERRIFGAPRYQHLSQLYGYLAKQFTVFGQHVHVGCADGDSALYLLHAMSRYIPHFIALAASSPYYQGVDTAFDSSRLNSVFAFPLSGRAPFVLRWDQFMTYFDKMRAFGVVESMKDFYWDIRPKPEYGTIEIRVFDTPLTVSKAAALAAYVQALARYLLVEPQHQPSDDLYLVYNYNRFQACRFGLDGELIDPFTQTRRSVREDILGLLPALQVHAAGLSAEPALEMVREWATRTGNDARWIRERFEHSGSLEDLMWQQSRMWSQAL